MSKRKSECTPEEWERQKAMSRERNKRYLEKASEEVKARRLAASNEYRIRLQTDPAYAERNEAYKKKAVERSKKWQQENPEKVKEAARNLRQRNPEKEVAKVQRRNASKLNAIPSWANKEAIDRHYANARYLSEVTGHQHHVDHIVPLRGELVCGLHVENNLRAIPHFLNTRKGNRFEGA